MNAPRACWLLLIASLLISAAHAAVDVHLSVAVHTDGGAGTPSVPPDRRYDLDATLGDAWMIVRNGTRTSFFDFERRRRSEIDESRHTRVDFSLFDAAGFRSMELANRQSIAKMMAAAKVPAAAFDPVEAEQALSIQDKPASPLQVAVDGDATVFSMGTKTLARVSTMASQVPSAQARMFGQLVRYTWGGHPQMLAALARSNAIPASLTLTTVEAATTTTLALATLSVRPSGVAPIDVAAIPLQPVSAAQTPVDRILTRGAAVSDTDIATARRRVHDTVDADFKDNQPFEAYLGLIEWVLTTGEPLPAMDAARTAALNADPFVVALRAALAPHPKAAMQRAIDELEALRPHARAQGHMLDLFVANDRATLGDRKAALDGLVAVLQARPFIAAAYKDLGDNLLLSFDAPDAWRCWDIGRRIAPGVSTFQAVNDFEQRLVALHPEYF